MKTKFILVLLLILVLLVVGCKSKTETQQLPSSDSLIEQAEESAKQIVGNVTHIIQQPSQTVFVPVETPSDGIVNKNYVAPCILAKYRGLNVYCKGKNIWHNYSTVTSWYVPYGIVLFLLLVFILWFIIKLWNAR